jgi:hypothetical protein
MKLEKEGRYAREFYLYMILSKFKLKPAASTLFLVIWFLVIWFLVIWFLIILRFNKFSDLIRGEVERRHKKLIKSSKIK